MNLQHLMLTAGILYWSPVAMAGILVEDFEDGSLASPSWSASTFYSISTDPTNASNLVLRGTGTSDGHRSIQTFFDGATPVPWEDFSFSVDLMSTVAASNVHGKVYIEFGDSNSSGSYSYNQRFDNGRLYNKPVGRKTNPPAGGDIFEDADQMIPFEWYRLSIWSGPGSSPDYVNIRFELLDTGTVLFQGASNFVGPPTNGTGISWIQLWTEETSPYYYDNFVIKTLIDGDLNFDGFVGIDDLNIILTHWNEDSGVGNPQIGGITGDGFVGVDDLNRVLGNWNAGTLPPVDAVAAIPEPSTAILLLTGGALCLRRRSAN